MRDRRYGTPEARRRANEAVYRRMLEAGGRILSFRIDAEQDARLIALALRENASRAAIAARILKRELQQDGQYDAVVAAADRLLSALAPLTRRWSDEMEYPEILSAIADLELALNRIRPA